MDRRDEDVRAEIERLRDWLWVAKQEPAPFAKTQELGATRRKIRELQAQIKETPDAERADGEAADRA